MELAEPQDLLAEALRDEAQDASREAEPLAQEQNELLERAEELADQVRQIEQRNEVEPIDLLGCVKRHRIQN